MASYGSVGVAPRVLVLVLLIAVLAFGGALWFDFLGLIDVRNYLAPLMGLVGLQPRGLIEDPEAIMLLEEERLAKTREMLSLREQELDIRERELESREAGIDQKTAALEERDRDFRDREKSFNDRVRMYENKRANLEQNARYLVGMPPNQAVEILVRMGDQDVIDHLRVTEELARAAGEDSIVAFWLSIMPPERAAAIQRKMALKTGGG